MASDNLNEEEKEIVSKCLQAIVKGGMIEKSDFESVIGASIEEVRAVAFAYPNVDECDDDKEGCDDSWIIINNAFANLIGYPGISDQVLQVEVGSNRDEIDRVFKKWKN